MKPNQIHLQMVKLIAISNKTLTTTTTTVINNNNNNITMIL
jgi:hypothetical protein